MVVQASAQRVIDQSELTLSLINAIRHKIVLMPALQPLAGEQVDKLHLALSEHLTNILRHNTEPCKVTINIIAQPKAISISDTGTDIADLLQAITCDTKAPDPLNESGRGLWLIRQSFPAFKYCSHNGVNTLTLPLDQAKPNLALIDDDPIQLALLNAWLSADYNLLIFSDPLQALAYLKNQPVDLIICDVKMPVMDGFILRQHLLDFEHTVTVPFLFVSALDDETLINRAAELAIDDFITKPIREVPLRSSIKRVLQRNLQLTQSVDVQLDKSITASLWHTLPTNWHGWQLNLAYLVASRGGGDFVFFQQRPSSLLIVLGDVMGHGTQAKFFAFAISGYLHGLCYVLAAECSPEELLQGLSSAICDNSLLQRTLVTALVIELFEDGGITLACAGHPAPLLSKADGCLHQFEVGGVLPGLQHDATYSQLQLTCQSGDTLLAFTDGLSEQFPQPVNTKNNTLIEQMSVLCLNPKTLNLHKFLHDNATQPLPDDVTLLAIRRV